MYGEEGSGQNLSLNMPQPPPQGVGSGANPFMSALGGMPQYAQQKQLHDAAVKQQMDKYDDDQLMHINNLLRVKPEMKTNPAIIDSVSKVFKRRGMPVDLSNGVDPALLMPPQPIPTYSELITGAGLSQESRKGVFGSSASPAYEDAQPSSPFTAAAKTASDKMVMSAIDDLTNDKSTPQAFVAKIQLIQHENPQLGDQLDQYLTPEFINQQASKMSQAKLDQMKAAGIHIQNEDTWRTNHTAELIREFGITSKQGQERADAARTAASSGVTNAQNNTTRTTADVSHLAALDRNMLSDLNIKSKQLELEGKRVQAYVSNVKTVTSGSQAAAYNKQTAPLLKMYAEAVGVRTRIGTSVGASGLPMTPDELDTFTKAGDQIATLQPTIDKIQTTLSAVASGGAQAVVPSGAGSIRPVDPPRPPGIPATARAFGTGASGGFMAMDKKSFWSKAQGTGKITHFDMHGNVIP